MAAPWTLAVLLWFGSSALIASPVGLAAGTPQKPVRSSQAAAAKPPGKPQDADAGRSLLLPGGELRHFDIRIVSPAPDDAVAGSVRVRAEVAADVVSSVAAVDFFVDGRLLFSDAEAPYELLWSAGRAAEHVLEVRAYGPGRQVVTDSLNVGSLAASPLSGFSARVERVELHVLIEEDEARKDATEEEPRFEVLENGVAQPIIGVERVADLPVAVGILIDHSGSMLERLETAMDAAGAFVEGLLTHPQDKAFVLGFADIPIVFQEFTNDTSRLADSIELIDGGRNTALYDAVVAAASRFEGSGGRRAVILLTDGADEGSEHRFREALEAAQRADIALYPVAVELSPRYARERWILGEMARETGGRVFSLGKRTDPAKIYDAIAEDLRSQYRISYSPLIPGGEGEWRALEVRLSGEDGKGRKTRARPGYFAH